MREFTFGEGVLIGSVPPSRNLTVAQIARYMGVMPLPKSADHRHDVTKHVVRTECRIERMLRDLCSRGYVEHIPRAHGQHVERWCVYSHAVRVMEVE